MTESKMTPDLYGEGYWEHGEGSNYVQYGDDPGWPLTAAVMRRYVDIGARVYELAAAKGYFVQWLRTYGIDAFGIDISPHAVSKANDVVREYLTLGNAVHTPWGSTTGACVCSWEFLEHVPEDELDDLFDEIERIAKPDALFIHRIGTLESEGDRSNHMHDHSHVTNYPSTWWRKKFEERGYIQQTDVEDDFNKAFAGRDWANRFFAYRKPQMKETG